MVTESCSFDTARLTVAEWHAAATVGPRGRDLAEVVMSLLTPAVTRALPPEWQGRYTRERAGQWVTERDDEGTTLLVTERASTTAVGLMITLESTAKGETGLDVRLGYVLAESVWGRGLGSELLDGFIRWCRAEAALRSLIAGVSEDNPASVRILEKNGFRPVAGSVEHMDAERIFELRLR